MIINGKRFENVQVFKRKGEQSYICIVEQNDLVRCEYQWITPFWAGVTTDDLEENWSARFFQQIVSADQYEVGVGDSPRYMDEYYSVSWNKTPELWRALFARALSEYFEFDIQQRNAA